MHATPAHLEQKDRPPRPGPTSPALDWGLRLRRLRTQTGRDASAAENMRSAATDWQCTHKVGTQSSARSIAGRTQANQGPNFTIDILLVSGSIQALRCANNEALAESFGRLKCHHLGRVPRSLRNSRKAVPTSGSRLRKGRCHAEPPRLDDVALQPLAPKHVVAPQVVQLVGLAVRQQLRRNGLPPAKGGLS